MAPLEAPEGWLAGLPAEFLRRDVRLVPIREAHTLRRPVFAKSPNDKSIKAMVYADGTRLPGSDAVHPSTPVLVSDPVDVVEEFRLHVFEGRVHTGSQYGDDGALRMAPLAGHLREAEVLAFAAELLAEQAVELPSAIVLDVGTVRPLSGGPARWAVIEANAAWAAGCYEADVERALDVVLRAAGPSGDLSDHDRRFVRPATSPGPVPGSG
ncbi:ATP-grasp domain-containing protein [Longispora sp. K20-0274]|uniref:ATP-grasp domain-containing protein n=1 Tax=Longispora sp. K20-0274 TaxID=3088255 RepID=UPI003999D4C0